MSGGEQKALPVWGLWVAVTLSMAGIVLLSIVPAGRLDYWQGWIFAASVVLMMIIGTVVFFRGNRIDMMSERARPGPGTKWWDKIIASSLIFLFFFVIALGSFDAGRMGWSPRFPAWLYVIAWVLFVASWIAFGWASWVNRFFSSVVRIQTERGHTVVRSGPYKWVRHPGYAFSMIMMPAMAIVLGSLWALVPVALGFLVLFVRTYLEDQMLQRELPGYADYAREVRWRLIPGIW